MGGEIDSNRNSGDGEERENCTIKKKLYSYRNALCRRFFWALGRRRSRLFKYSVKTAIAAIAFSSLWTSPLRSQISVAHHKP